MALTDNLVSYWKLDEASGNALDAHGSNELTDNNTVGTGTGKIGNARDLEASSAEYFNRTDNADLSLGDTDWTLAGWIRGESITGYPIVASKGWANTLGVNSEFALYVSDIYSSQLRLEVASGSGSSAAGAINASSFGTLTTNAWYFFVAWHDAANNILGISVNNTSNTTSYSLGANDGNQAFVLGASPAQSLYWDGLLDEVGFWRRVLTSQERTDLYNSGNGLEYPFTTDTPLFAGGGECVGLPIWEACGLI